MATDLASSSEFGSLIDDNGEVLITPICPICRKNYSHKVVPVSLQPCNHGMCQGCYDDYEAHNGEETLVTCPTCRETVLRTKPNYDLISITETVKNDNLTYWEKRLAEMAQLRGLKIQFHTNTHCYSKLIVTRLIYDDVLKDIVRPRDYWEIDQIRAVRSIANACTYALRHSLDELSIASRWISAMGFTQVVEDFLLKFVIKWYDNKTFLEKEEMAWVLDVVTQPV